MDDVNKEFTIIREFDAPRDLVFKAWTDPKHIAEWWGPKGVFTPVCEIDARPGGLINIVMEAGEELGSAKGMKWPMKGTFEEIVEPSKIVFLATAINNDKPSLEHRTTVTFEEQDGKTKMTVHVVVTKLMDENVPKDALVVGMEQGWNSQFDKLVEFIKKGTRE